MLFFNYSPLYLTLYKADLSLIWTLSASRKKFANISIIEIRERVNGVNILIDVYEINHITTVEMKSIEE